MQGGFYFSKVSKTQNIFYNYYNKQTYDAKALCQKGNSPDHKLKSLINIKCKGFFKLQFKGKFAQRQQSFNESVTARQ